MLSRSIAASTVLALALSACSQLPSYGPSLKTVYRDSEPENNPLGFRIVELDKQTVDRLASLETAKAVPAPRMAPAPPVDTIGFGDQLSISIFEAGAGLFAGGGGGGASSAASGDGATAETGGGGGASSVTLPRLTVDRNGTVAVPYAGRIKVLHLTPAEVAARIEAKLKNKAAQPQVIVEIAKNEANTFLISGDIKSPGLYPLTLAHERLSDAVSLAGGPLHSDRDTVVTLVRPSGQSSTLLRDVDARAEDDLVLAPHDRIRVEYHPRSFTVFGALGRPAEVAFDSSRVTLAEGLARSAGLMDYQADARGLFVFRLEQPSVAQAAGVPVSGDYAPVIYHADLSNSVGYFLIQRFQLRDKDLVYVSDAPALQLQKLLSVFNGLFTPVAVTRQVTQ